MAPDLLWVAIFSLGGIAIGLTTSLVGLPKGQELLGWLVHYGFMVTTATVVKIADPFWTVLAASLASSTIAGAIQLALLPQFRAKNPWLAAELAKPVGAVARGLFGFALFTGSLFGLLAAAAAWTLARF